MPLGGLHILCIDHNLWQTNNLATLLMDEGASLLVMPNDDLTRMRSGSFKVVLADLTVYDDEDAAFRRIASLPGLPSFEVPIIFLISRITAALSRRAPRVGAQLVTNTDELLALLTRRAEEVRRQDMPDVSPP